MQPKAENKNWVFCRRLLSPAYHQMRRTLATAPPPGAEARAAWQLERLRPLLVRAQQTVPYYQKTFRAAGVDPAALTDLREFQRYPIVSKADYRADPEAFLAEDADRRSLFRRYTGGTTGEPVPFFRDSAEDAREHACTNHVYARLGIGPWVRKAYFRGPVDDARGRFMACEELGLAWRFSTSNMTEPNLARYLEKMRAFKPQLLYGVPSSLVIWCDYLERNRLAPPPGLKWVFAQSETLYEFQERIIERVLGIPVLTSYGQTEHVVSAWRCPQSRHYHVLPHYGITELLDDSGNPVREGGRPGRVIGTGFGNSHAPLIRYDTGDRAQLAATACPCGCRDSSWGSIEGRTPSTVFTKGGGRACLGPMLLCQLYEESRRLIRRFGIEQHQPGALVVKVEAVRSEDLPEVERLFRSAIENEYPKLFDLTVVQEAQCASSKANKQVFFRQYVRDANLTANL
jgi:phenylacetate-CoA ligase